MASRHACCVLSPASKTQNSCATARSIATPTSTRRNCSPKHCNCASTHTFFAGQISGVEGYTESIASGLIAGIFAAALAHGQPLQPLPRASGLGSLVHYITHADPKRFQPANITFDLLEPLDEATRRSIRDKKERHRLQCERALAHFDTWWQTQQELWQLTAANVSSVRES